MLTHAGRNAVCYLREVAAACRKGGAGVFPARGKKARGWGTVMLVGRSKPSVKLEGAAASVDAGAPRKMPAAGAAAGAAGTAYTQPALCHSTGKLIGCQWCEWCPGMSPHD